MLWGGFCFAINIFVSYYYYVYYLVCVVDCCGFVWNGFFDMVLGRFVSSLKKVFCVGGK